MSSASKQAVVYVIDASPSMAKPYPGLSSKASQSTRLSVSKEVVQGHLADLMLQSKTNEASVIAAGTEGTSHRFSGILSEDDRDSIQYPHITELSKLNRPSTSLLRKINDIQVTDDGDKLRGEGGFANAIILAASALSNRTYSKQYQRNIFVFTDAERQVDIDMEALEEAIYRLNDMDCKITVVGLDFKNSTQELKLKLKTVQNEEGSEEDINIAEQLKDEKDELLSDNERVKSDNEKFLISLTEHTGGEVFAASNLHQLVEQSLGKRIPKSTLKKIEFMIAPGVVVQGRLSLAASKARIPSIKKEAVMVESDGKTPMINALGEEMVAGVRNVTSHFDDTLEDWNEIPLAQRVDAYAYGSDLIPIGEIDLQGTKLRSPPRITVLGYVPVESIPIYSLIGPSRILSGDKSSRRACCAISALAQALLRLKQVGICSLVSIKDADPVMGILYPLPFESHEDNNIDEDKDEKRKAYHLQFLQIPFSDDVEHIVMRPFDDSVGDEESRDACMSVIDNLMLPKGVLSSKSTANPAIRCFRKTLIHRALHSGSQEIIGSRVDDNLICTPESILNAGKTYIEKIRKSCPLEKMETNTRKNGKKLYFDDAE
jgi:ATP-dependent DNA helicase 2 subunit 2